MILVTGSGGLVGRALVPALLERGLKVRVLLRSGQTAEEQRSLGCEVLIGDVTDRTLVKRALAGAETVYHLAASLRGDKKRYESVNYQATVNLVKEAEKDAHMVFMSYLPSDPEEHNFYLSSKGRAEQAVSTSAHPYTIFRCSLIYGPGGELARVIKSLLRLPLVPLPGFGKTKLQPVFVGDVVSCLIQSLGNENQNKVYELGGPEVVEDRELLRLSAEIMGKRKWQLPIPFPLAVAGAAIWQRLSPLAPATVNEVMLSRYPAVCDISAIRTVFGEPRTSLEEGLRKSLLISEK